MPATTPNLAIPYPLGTEAPAGHSNMQALASAVDTAIGPRSAWLTQAPVAGFAGSVQYRKMNGFVTIDLKLTRASAWTPATDILAVATLPAGYRPTVNVSFLCMVVGGNTVFRAAMNSTGAIDIYLLLMAAAGGIQGSLTFPAG